MQNIVYYGSISTLTFFLVQFNLLVSSCLPEDEAISINSLAVFEKVENQIDFANLLTETYNNSILNYNHFYNGGGVAVADFNKDSLPDVFLTGNKVESTFYLNQGNFKFEKLEIKALKAQNRWSTGASIVDINKDGWMDIYICNSGPDFSKSKRHKAG